MSLCGELAAFASALDAKTLGGDVAAFAGQCLLDATGNMIAGTASEKTKYLEKGPLMASDGPACCRIVGGGKATATAAAFANSLLLRALDLDDGHRYAMGHPGSVLVPTALAAAEMCGGSGADFIAALVAGYEIYARLGAVVNPHAYSDLGFESTGTCGAVAAAAVVGRTYGLAASTMADALGLAALFSGGLIEYQNDGTSGKVVCPGWAAVNGFRAVELARAGFTGPVQAFEGKQGFFHAHGTDLENPAAVLGGLGERYSMLDTYFKVHGCMRGLHASIDGALALRREGALDVADVSGVEVRTSSYVKRLDRPYPQSITEAQVNVGYVLATALVYGSVSWETLSRGFSDERVAALYGRVEVVVDDEAVRHWQANPSHWGASRVVIRTAAGETLSSWTPIARGERENPMPWEELRDKFVKMCAGTRFAARADELASAVSGVAACGDLRKWMDLLA